MERFVIGHNVDPSNWRQRMERLAPRCLEVFVPPGYAEGTGLVELRHAFEEMAKHPATNALEFVSCHFPWGEGGNGHSNYNLVDHQYFYPFMEIAKALEEFRAALDLPPDRCALNFHNLYELPRPMLEELKARRELTAIREILVGHALNQTRAARDLLDTLNLSITLVNENNPPIGDGDRMSIVDVFSEDGAARNAAIPVRSCMDLSHFFMTRFYYDMPAEQRPSFPYLEEESDHANDCVRTLKFAEYVENLRPLYFHVSDTKAPGTSREFEGLPVGKGDTPWSEALPVLAKYATTNHNKVFLIIEIKNGHTAAGTEQCELSERRLLGLIEDCFADGFMEAVSEGESVS